MPVSLVFCMVTSIHFHKDMYPILRHCNFYLNCKYKLDTQKILKKPQMKEKKLLSFPTTKNALYLHEFANLHYTYSFEVP